MLSTDVSILVYVAYKVSQHDCTHITTGTLIPYSLACLVLSTPSRDPAPCPFQLGSLFVDSPTTSGASSPSFGSEVEVFDGPRVGQGPGPMHQRSASERFEEAMEDGYMEVGSGCVEWIRFDSIRLLCFDLRCFWSRDRVVVLLLSCSDVYVHRTPCSQGTASQGEYTPDYVVYPTLAFGEMFCRFGGRKYRRWYAGTQEPDRFPVVERRGVGVEDEVPGTSIVVALLRVC